VDGLGAAKGGVPVTGYLYLTPFAREAISPVEATALRRRVPPNKTLRVSGGPRSSGHKWIVALVSDVGLEREVQMPELAAALAVVLDD